MKTSYIYLSISIALVLFSPNISNAASAILSEYPTILEATIPANELQQKYSCVIVRPEVDTSSKNNKYEKIDYFTYTETHDIRFITASPRGDAKQYAFSTGGQIIYFYWYPNTFSCPKDKIDNLILSGKATSAAIGFWKDPIAGTIHGIFNLLNGFTAWLGGLLTSGIFLKILQQGVFVQNDLVKQGWPFVQGFANLGFIIALLYIALATTLRIESVTNSVQRLLPKLLIGALLVNFSLVIGGLVIDASRLLMVVELKFVAGKDVADGDIIAKIMQASRTYETAQSIINQKPSSDKWMQLILIDLQQLLVNLAISIGFGIIALNLFVRYIILLVLLIFSPLAYLAIALPQTYKYFIQWWSLFIKWVVYGPLVLFFLILIAKINSIGLPPDSGTFAYVAQFGVVIALLFAGHIASKKAAGVGSDVVMGFAAKHPKTTAALAGTILTGGLGGAIIGAGAVLATQSARPIGSKALQYADERSGFKEFRKIRRSGISKKKQDKIDDTFLANKAKYDYGTEQYRSDVDAANAVRSAAKRGAEADDPSLTADKLKRTAVGKAIEPSQIDKILKRGVFEMDNHDQIEAIVNNPTIVAKMSNEDKSTLNVYAETKLASSNKLEQTQGAQLLQSFQRSVREAEKKRVDDQKLPELKP